MLHGSRPALASCYRAKCDRVRETFSSAKLADAIFASAGRLTVSHFHKVDECSNRCGHVRAFGIIEVEAGEDFAKRLEDPHKFLVFHERFHQILDEDYRDKMVVETGRGLPLKFPLTPGSDLAGEVVALGEGASRFELGSNVI